MQNIEQRKRTTTNSAKDPAIVWEALSRLKEEAWFPEQISADMKSPGKNISHELIYTDRHHWGTRLTLPSQNEIQPSRTTGQNN